MFKNYLIVAVRNILRHKFYAIINIAGLSVGMACTILIFVWVQYQFSFDRFHENKDRICRLEMKWEWDAGKNRVRFPFAQHAAGPALVREYPEAVQSVRFRHSWQRPLVQYKDKQFHETNLIFADNSVFDIFTFPMIKGDPNSALTRPFSIVITKNMAIKYFGDEDPLGKVFTITFQRMTDVFEKFKNELSGNLGCVITTDDLIRAGDLYNRLRSDMKRIFNLRRKNPSLISSNDLQAIVKASMIMDREIFLDKLSAVASDLKATKPQPSPPLKRLVLSGGMCNIPSVHSLIEDCGAAIIWDDSCSGARYFEGAIDPESDITESIAKRHIEKIECPAKHAALSRRGESLVSIAKTYQAEGVIFLLLKFCDPHAFDYPYIKELLDKEGIASMLLEIEAPLPSEAQLKTRCQAFLEML